MLFPAFAARLSDLTSSVLLPIFLAFSGLNTDFTTLGTAYIGGILLFLAAAILAKWVGGAVFARLGGLSWAEGNVLGILMNCRGLLVLVVALIGLNAGVISPQFQAAGVLMALVTTAMTGPLFDRFLPAATRSAGDDTRIPAPWRRRSRNRSEPRRVSAGVAIVVQFVGEHRCSLRPIAGVGHQARRDEVCLGG